MRVDKQGKTRSARPNDWTDVLAPEVIRQFEGKHIAIVYKRVVASGSTFDAVLEECLQLFPNETPYLAYIPTPEEAEEEDYSVAGTYVQGQSDGPVRQAPGDIVELERRLIHDQTYIPPVEEVPSFGPFIGALTPLKGPVGSVVTITGTRLGGITQVLFGGTPASSFTLVSDTSLFAVVPAGVTTGSLSLVTATGVVTSKQIFVVMPPPAITSFKPSQGGIGTRVRIVGEFLAETTTVVFEDGVPAKISAKAHSVLEVDIPANAAGGKFMVTTPGGIVWSSSGFTVVPPPVVERISPSNGAPGTLLTITGLNLGSAANVLIGGNRADSVSVVSPTEITAVVPFGVSSGVITVSTDGGSASGTSRFTVIQQPVVKSFAPAAGGPGSKVMITGANLSGTSGVDFDGLPAVKFTVISPAFVSVEIPAGAFSGPISVTTSGGTARSLTDFLVVPPPRISSIEPLSDAAGGSFQITGENLQGATKILLDDSSVESFVVESSNSIIFEIDRPVENGLIKLTTPGGTADFTGNFTIAPFPTITSFSPTFGPVGTVVTVNGTHLETATEAFVNIAKANVSAVTGSKATVFVPAEATSGRIVIVTPDGRCESKADFDVITASAIKDITPSSGVAGSYVTIMGWGFKSTSAVLFGGLPSPSITINSNNSITAQSPFGARSGDIVIDSPTGGAAGARPFLITLSITTIQPASGPSGTPVAISGVGFADVTAVLFNGVKAQFETLSDTTLTAKAPASGTNGPIQIITPLGSTFSASEFVYD
jgi:hypothetical protein